jgi:hypothetical protein
MTRPAQTSFLPVLTAPVVEKPAAIEIHDFPMSDQYVPGSLADVPAMARLTGEEGYVEVDRFFQGVKS